MSEIEQATITRITHGYVRWLMILLPLLLFVVSVGTGVGKGEFEPSISAYYGGPVRDILVGTLVATAACLVAYQGVGLLEDYALNGAGFYAVFVALVPTGFSDIMADLRANPSPDGVTATDYGSFLRIALSGVVLLCAGLLVRELRSGNPRELVTADVGSTSRFLARVFVLITSVLLVAFLALAMWQLWRGPADQITLQGITLPGGRQVSIHFLAAVFLISSLCVAVLTNTWPFFTWGSALWKSGRGNYLVILALMTVGLVVPWLISTAVAPDHLVLLIEWWEILLFIAFWTMETYRIERARVTDAGPGPLREPHRVHDLDPSPGPQLGGGVEPPATS